MQTRVQSFIESIANIVIGYTVAVISQILIFPLVGVHVSVSENLYIAAWFTVISIIRSYLLRRFFNKVHSIQNHRGLEK